MKVVFTLCVLLAVASAMSLRTHFRSASQPLQITVLTESLCPDCKEFITGSYARAIQASGIDKLANITIIPFGNAQETQSAGKYVFTCQHGANECLGNAIENCLFAHVEKQTAEKILVCLETKIDVDRNWGNALSACGIQVGADLSSLMTCANSDEGMMLTHDAAQRTDPQHQYVPWVVVNGQHDTDAENQILENLIQYACSQYNGSEPLPVCQSHKFKALKDDQPLQIMAFTESLCPGCQEFTLGSFSNAINTQDIEKIANITLVPFGNAHETQSAGHYVFTCQHGADECLGNTILNCILNQHDKLTAQKALVCMESKRRSGTAWQDALTACSKEQGVDLSQAMTCANGPDGEKFMHQAAQNTDPNHKYVPWITVGGVHDSDVESAIMDNLVSYACKNYKGSVKIAACATHTKPKRSFNRSYNNVVHI